MEPPKLSEEVRAVLEAAGIEAARLGHEYIGTEHLLLAALGAEDGEPPPIFRDLNIDPHRILNLIESVIPAGAPGNTPPGSALPFTTRAGRALDLAMTEAVAMGHDIMSTEHLILGLVLERGGIAAQVLNHAGLTERAIRTQMPSAARDENRSRELLQHFLAALAYRTQKALRGAPADFADFRVAPTARTPFELIWHMTGVIGNARTMLNGGEFEPPRLGSLAAEVTRFHEVLEALHDDFENNSLHARITDEQFLQGPLSDAMTHAGQLAMLRRLHGNPVPPENFIFANIARYNVGETQSLPIAPDQDWDPDNKPHPPGPGWRSRDR
ncbi:MAG: Clp protease N-terminal domain-containing protein [Gemmatimonadaceae bacterium]